MAKDKPVKYADQGHEEILRSILKKHRLVLEQTFVSNHTLCSVATNGANKKVFIKVKGLEKNKSNERRHRRVANNYRTACTSKNPATPKLIEFHAFERDQILWMTSLSAYGGNSICKGPFFEGDDATIDKGAIGRIRRSISVIQNIPAATAFYGPSQVSEWISIEFGTGVMSTASVWTSAHCDFHWGNILQGAHHVVDWDMFSLAPRGFDIASILFFSSSNPGLFDRLYQEFHADMDDDSCRVATLFAAARLLRMMKVHAYADWSVYEPNIRAAVSTMVGPGVLVDADQQGKHSKNG